MKVNAIVVTLSKNEKKICYVVTEIKAIKTFNTKL